MATIFMFSIAYVYFIFSDLIPMFKEKKTFIVKLAIMAFAYVLCVLYALKLNIPSPAVLIENIVEGIVGKQ